MSPNLVAAALGAAVLAFVLFEGQHLVWLGTGFSVWDMVAFAIAVILFFTLGALIVERLVHEIEGKSSEWPNL